MTDSLDTSEREAEDPRGPLILPVREMREEAVPLSERQDLTPPEILASRLIDAWCAAHGRPIPWEMAVEITAITTKMPEAERARLLALDRMKGNQP